MKTKKTGLLLMIFALVFTFVISACGNSNNTNTSKEEATTETPKAEPTASGPVEVEYWMHESEPREDDYKRKRIEEFNKANEGKIKVNLIGVPRGQSSNGYEERMNVAITSNSLPDIVDVDGPNAAAYVESGILGPMDEYLTKDDLSDFVGSIIEQGTYNGKMYLLAPLESNVVLYYNKKALADAGIKPAMSVDEAWTWDEFYANAKKLKKGDTFPVNFFDNYGVGEWQTYMATPFVWSNGSNIISPDGSTTEGYLNSPETVEVLQNIAKFYKEGLATVSPGPTDWEDQKSVLAIGGHWVAGGTKGFEYGMMPLPKYKEGKSPSGGWSFGITTQSESPKEAVEVIKWLTNPETVKGLSETLTAPPSRKTVFDQLDNFKKEPLNTVADQLKNTAQARPRTPAYPVLSKAFAEAYNAAALGQDVKPVLDEAVKRVDQEIKRLKK